MIRHFTAASQSSLPAPLPSLPSFSPSLLLILLASFYQLSRFILPHFLPSLLRMFPPSPLLSPSLPFPLLGIYPLLCRFPSPQAVITTLYILLLSNLHHLSPSSANLPPSSSFASFSYFPSPNMRFSQPLTPTLFPLPIFLCYTPLYPARSSLCRSTTLNNVAYQVSLPCFSSSHLPLYSFPVLPLLHSLDIALPF